MIDTCYQNFEFNDVLKILGGNQKDALFENKIKVLANTLFEQGEINWKVLPDNTIFRRIIEKNLFLPEVIMGDMIGYAQHSERIY